MTASARALVAVLVRLRGSVLFLHLSRTLFTQFFIERYTALKRKCKVKLEILNIRADQMVRKFCFTNGHDNKNSFQALACVFRSLAASLLSEEPYSIVVHWVTGRHCESKLTSVQEHINKNLY